MSFTEAISSGFQNAFDFKGRAGVGEIWKWILFTLLIGLAVDIVVISQWGDASPFRLLDDLILLIPNISIGVRRLHDTGKSGWRLLWMLTIVGFLYIIYLYVQPSDKTSNKYGEPPVGAKKSDFVEGARFTREK
tara:strand:+ start:13334 stop:13735 length:402 start_codon:yes stop_codon:yes gene_type:complete